MGPGIIPTIVYVLSAGIRSIITFRRIKAEFRLEMRYLVWFGLLMFYFRSTLYRIVFMAVKGLW